MDSSEEGKVEVIATAIDGEHLVLETVPNKNRIQWPLKNLPRPLPIGSRLTLELQGASPVSGDANSNTNPPGGDKDEIRRKLLEDLVN